MLGPFKIKMVKNNFYRLAAMLYASEGKSTKREVAIRKIVENILVINNNKSLTVNQISLDIKSQYDLIIVYDEITKVVTDSKNRNFQIDYSYGEIKINLKESRFNSLCDLCEKNLDFYIDTYIKETSGDDNEKEIIHKYIYKLFENNLSEFYSILNGESRNEERADFTEDENKIVKAFLDWNNLEKNQMLSSIANYALEYTFLTANGGSYKNIRNIFSSKKIYLDTNIIFYCIGINGDDYLKTNKIFLEKCKSSKSKLFISYYTNEEFQNTISHVVEEIDKYSSASMFNCKFQAKVSNEDIYKLYLKWANGRKQLREGKYFKAYLKEEYSNLINEFNITVEKSKPYNDNEIEDNDILNGYFAEISVNTQENYDALNIFYLENKRGNNEDIVNTQYIFISADASLQRWDRNRGGIPIVISPSAWLTLMAKLDGRTDDDYYCFVNFINLKVVDNELNNKEYFQVIKVLSEMIEDIEIQENVLDVMIEENFSFLKSDGKRTFEFISNETQKEAKVIIDEKIIKSLKKNEESKNNKIEDLTDKLSETEKKYYKQGKLLEKAKNDNEDKIKLKEENDNLVKQIQINEKLNKKILKHAIIMLIITLPILMEIVAIFIYKVQNPLTYRLYMAIIKDSIYEPQGIEGYFKIGQAVLTFVVITMDFKLSKIMWSKKTKKDFKEELIDVH